uniref:Meiotic double-stranded break formation protein 4 n=1 Tax=Equus caballus TaxID=9796 RepID=A0A9L0RPI5_HORSE
MVAAKETKAKMDDQASYLRTSKLALALAIIHSKPADKSGREHAEHLARVVSGQESKWRLKVEALEAEVLQLRQKLLLSKIHSGLFDSGDPSTQLQAQEPRCSENTLSLLEDSGCGLSNEQRTEPSEMSQHFGESCTPTPFPPLPIVKRHGATPENPLSSHMQFLQHLLELKNLTESGSLKTDLSLFENDYSAVSDSVFQLLDGLIAFYRKPKFPFSSFWTEAVDTLARLISDCNLSIRILKKCSKKLEEFEKTLLQIILRNNHINRFQVQHCVSQCLVTLGSCSLLRKSIISLLLSEVNIFADDLGTINQILQSHRQLFEGIPDASLEAAVSKIPYHSVSPICFPHQSRPTSSDVSSDGILPPRGLPDVSVCGLPDAPLTLTFGHWGHFDHRRLRPAAKFFSLNCHKFLLNSL